MFSDTVCNLEHQRPLSFLNLSHASFRAAKTVALIIFCSVEAFCGILRKRQYVEWSNINGNFTLSGCTFAIAFM